MCTDLHTLWIYLLTNQPNTRLSLSKVYKCIHVHMQDKVDEAETMMLKFSLSWSRGPPKHRLISELETALDLQRLRNG